MIDSRLLSPVSLQDVFILLMDKSAYQELNLQIL